MNRDLTPEPRIRGTRITLTELAAIQSRIAALVNQLNAEIAEAIEAGARIKVAHEETEIPVRPWILQSVTVVATAQPVIGANED